MKNIFQINTNLNSNQDSALDANVNPNNDFTRKIIGRMPTCYAGITSVFVYDTGSGYPASTSVLFPEPDLNSGSRAQGFPILGITIDSFDLLDGGSGYDLGEVFDITNAQNQLVGFLIIGDVDSSGSITKFMVLNMYDYSCNTSPVIKWKDNTTAIIATNDQNFQILAIEMTNIGSGYEYYSIKNNKPTRTIHPIILQNSGNGSGAVMRVNQAPFEKFQIKEKQNLGPYNDIISGIQNFEIDTTTISYVNNNFTLEN